MSTVLPIFKSYKKVWLVFLSIFCISTIPNIRSDEAVNIGNTLLFGNGNFDTKVRPVRP